MSFTTSQTRWEKEQAVTDISNCDVSHSLDKL